MGGRGNVGAVSGHVRPKPHGGAERSLNQLLGVIASDEACGEPNEVESEAGDPEFSPGAMATSGFLPSSFARRGADTNLCRDRPQRGNSEPDDRCAILGEHDRRPCRSDDCRENITASRYGDAYPTIRQYVPESYLRCLADRASDSPGSG